MIHPRLFEFRLPLVKPLTIGEDVWTRNGFLIALTDDMGNMGWGEASPLPGLSVESSEDLKVNWASLHSWFGNLPVPTRLNWDLLESLESAVRLPSLRFGVETALCRLFSVRERTPWPKALNSHAGMSVQCNGLIAGDSDSWPSQLNRILQQCYRHVKIKMGRENLDQELKAFSSLVRTSHGNLMWRIDANRAWSLSETEMVVSACKDISLEYIEEPLKNAEDWPHALELPHAKLALDEQLQNIMPDQLSDYRGASAVILKPTWLGGMVRSRAWALAAQRNGMACTLSSCFESGCGLLAIAELHSALPGFQLAAGLDTVQWLQEDTLQAPFSVLDGVVDWSSRACGGLSINFHNLTEVM